MNKAELVDLIAKDADISKTAAAKALNSVIDGITDALSRDEVVTFVNFGTFYVKERAARKGRNPQTGKEIHIKATKVAGFKAGKTLKEVVQKDK